MGREDDGSPRRLFKQIHPVRTIQGDHSKGDQCFDGVTVDVTVQKAIEEKFEPLKGVLPKDYGIFEPKVLEELMRVFNSEQIKQATLL